MDNFKFFDNMHSLIGDDLKETITNKSKVQIAAACFSIYAFKELKKSLKNVDELKFIFTSPTFISNIEEKSKKEFYIKRISREKSLYGTEFEFKLRNELSQKAIAKECADWIKKKVKFKSNITQKNMTGFINVCSEENQYTYNPFGEFTTVNLGYESGNDAYITSVRLNYPQSNNYVELFEQLWNDNQQLQDVTNEVIEAITTVYNENSPEFIYFFTLYNIFNEFLEDISEDNLPNEATGFKKSKVWSMLYDFQRDAVLAIINKLEKYNGCILADSVGLGKTFTSLAVAKYYESRNKNVLILCPKKLSDNWNTYKENYVNNPLAEDRLNYKVLYHTDIGRTKGISNGIDLSRFRWDTFDLIIIDESHNFRNGGKFDGDGEYKENRYAKLLNNVIRKGVKTKVLMLSATPVNTRFNDLKNQLQLAYEGNSEEIDEKLKTTKSIDEIFRGAQKVFNMWSKYKVEDRTADKLLKMLDFDFFEVLDSVTIARSRKHIEKYYDTTGIGKFPNRLKPKSFMTKLTDLDDVVSYNEIFEQLNLLNLEIYKPSSYILPSKIKFYSELHGDEKVNVGFTQANREQGVRKLMAINLMKRLESSIHSFRLTLNRMKDYMENILEKIDEHRKVHGVHSADFIEYDLDEFEACDFDDQNSEEMHYIGSKLKIKLSDIDWESWEREIIKDLYILEKLISKVDNIVPKHDCKLQELLEVIKNKVNNPINNNNKKIIIFTAFADTAIYLYDHVSSYVKKHFDLNTAVITGSVEGKTTVSKMKIDLNTVLTYFSPLSKNKELLFPNDDTSIDILIATDCISEGQNLQDCDYLINYDIHWNPVRIIQRFGRVDRIGSKNKYIQLVNFWPDITLDEYINLKSRVETRMKIIDMTATGDDNLLSNEEKNDLEYRKLQLQRLQEEVVDIEEMNSSISIMDLGLNEFRLDLIDYVKSNSNFENVPIGLHSVVKSMKDIQSGVIYVLKNRNENINLENKNRLHPFYIVYVSDEGEVILNHLSIKDILDKMRFLCKNNKEPIPEVYNTFNIETKDGKDMSKLSNLLQEAVSSIINVKDSCDIDDFLNGNQMSFVNRNINGIDDFELICFLVIK